jgi:hypothetical protein
LPTDPPAVVADAAPPVLPTPAAEPVAAVLLTPVPAVTVVPTPVAATVAAAVPTPVPAVVPTPAAATVGGAPVSSPTRSRRGPPAPSRPNKVVVGRKRRRNV